MNPFIQFLSSYVSLESNEIRHFDTALVNKIILAGEKILKAGNTCKSIIYVLKGQARSYFINNEGQEYTWSFYFNDSDSEFENLI